MTPHYTIHLEQPLAPAAIFILNLAALRLFEDREFVRRAMEYTPVSTTLHRLTI